VDRDLNDPDEGLRSKFSRARRAVSGISPIASLVMATWFGWSLLGGEDSIPTGVNVASLVAAVIVFVDACTQLFARHRDQSA
jgi:hypothetical protein